MKERTLYQCEYCYTEYDNKEECEKCENYHKAIRIGGVEYGSYKSGHDGFPLRVKIISENGNFCWYRKM